MLRLLASGVGSPFEATTMSYIDSSMDPAWSGANVTGLPGAGFDPSSSPSSSGSGPTGSQLLGLGVLGAGAAGFGALLAQGPSQLPWEYNALTNNVPALTN